MKQREVQDQNNTRWVCVEALSGLSDNSSEVAEKIQDRNGKVPVVCTPSGGAQTVRIKVNPDWVEKLSDEELVSQIIKNQ
ncbi:MAG TPA: hypothetical protein VGD40_03915 [Chryseosolibacter sp.]